MMFGSVKMDNKVDGNKPIDNKDPKNKQKTMKSASQKGLVGANAGNTKLSVQNSSQYDDSLSPKSGNQDGNATVRKADKYSKKPTAGRQTMYSDGAMAVAKRARGMN